MNSGVVMGIIRSIVSNAVKKTVMKTAYYQSEKMIDKKYEKDTQEEPSCVKLIAKEYTSNWKKRLDVFDESGDLQFIIKYYSGRTQVDIYDSEENEICNVELAGTWEGSLNYWTIRRGIRIGTVKMCLSLIPLKYECDFNGWTISRGAVKTTITKSNGEIIKSSLSLNPFSESKYSTYYVIEFPCVEDIFDGLALFCATNICTGE